LGSDGWPRVGEGQSQREGRPQRRSTGEQQHKEGSGPDPGQKNARRLQGLFKQAINGVQQGQQSFRQHQRGLHQERQGLHQVRRGFQEERQGFQQERQGFWAEPGEGRQGLGGSERTSDRSAGSYRIGFAEAEGLWPGPDDSPQGEEGSSPNAKGFRREDRSPREPAPAEDQGLPQYPHLEMGRRVDELCNNEQYGVSPPPAAGPATECGDL
jgi:hypothetical protein